MNALSHPRLGLVLFVGAWILSGCAMSSKAVKPSDPMGWQLLGLDGSVHTVAWKSNSELMVVEFLGSECPIANRVLPELARLAREFSSRGVQFVAVYPNVGETAEAIRQHREQLSDPTQVGMDPEQQMVSALQAQVTPEVVVLARNGALVYRGRVNDQYAALGKSKPAPTRHDLEVALRDYLTHRIASGVKTPPVGCRIQRLP